MGVNAPSTCELQVQQFPMLGQMNGLAEFPAQMPRWGNLALTFQSTLDFGVKNTWDLGLPLLLTI